MRSIKKHIHISQKGALALFCVFWSICSFSQISLVPNPSFEDSISIPLSHSEFPKAKNWYTLTGSCDYFSVYSPTLVAGPGGSVYIPKNIFGYQKARTKNFYAGIIIRSLPVGSPPPFVMYRESFAVKLTQTLTANHSYSFTMYYSLAEVSQITTNQLSAYFSTSQFLPGTNLYDTSSYYNYLPMQINHDNSFITDSINWIPLTGCFIAKGGEEYLNIGNFKDALHSPTTTASSNSSGSCYIYIDDVSLYDMGFYSGKAQCKNDTLICSGNSFIIGTNIKDSSQYFWSPSSGLSCTACPNPIVTPTAGISTYYLIKQQCSSITSKDSIKITVHTATTTAKPGLDSTICLGDAIVIGTKDSLSFTSYAWQPSSGLSCTNCATPMANPITNTTYTLQRTECAFVTSNDITITIDDCEPTYTVPNIFTPNYDGKNDTWGIIFSNSKYIKDFSVTVYDRWGVMVFASEPGVSTPNLKWDGHTTSGMPCADGVYFYVISFTKNEELVQLKGYLALYK